MTLKTNICAECGIEFAAPADWWAARQRDGAPWWCPNGHRLVFSERTETKLQREIDRMRQDGARLELEAAAARREAEAATRSLKRLRSRVQAGVCPDCNRSFSDLARHMAGKHQLHAEAVTPPAAGAAAAVIPIRRPVRSRL